MSSKPEDVTVEDDRSFDVGDGEAEMPDRRTCRSSNLACSVEFETTAHVQRLARDVAALRREEKDNGVRDVLGRSDPPEGNGRCEAGKRLRRRHTGQSRAVGVDGAVMSVSTIPGHTAFTVIQSGPGRERPSEPG